MRYGKMEVAQKNEALLKVLAHNIVCLVHSIHELGISAMLSDLRPAQDASLDGAMCAVSNLAR
jgi:hypothetical protein